jgi:OFA family oxalate/formate antiporter-like MFS transporter
VTPDPTRSRWTQLILGVISMLAISSPQYVWTLFTQPLMASLGASLPDIQITFSILIVVQTFLAPFQGFLVDAFGPRLLLSLGGAITGSSWVLAAHATSLSMLYATYGLLGGIGTGIVYVGVIGHMVQWFPDRRGLATGLVAAGYGVGAILTTFPVSSVLKQAGHPQALTQFGLIFMVVGVAAAQGLRRPAASGEHFPMAPGPHPRRVLTLMHRRSLLRAAATHGRRRYRAACVRGDEAGCRRARSIVFTSSMIFA